MKLQSLPLKSFSINGGFILIEAVHQGTPEIPVIFCVLQLESKPDCLDRNDEAQSQEREDDSFTENNSIQTAQKPSFELDEVQPVHSFVRSFVHSFIQSIIHSFI